MYKFQIDKAYFKDHLDTEYMKRFFNAAEINGQMLLICSEMLAFVPYLIRSLRISKVMKARDIYCETGQMPFHLIR